MTNLSKRTTRTTRKAQNEATQKKATKMAPMTGQPDKRTTNQTATIGQSKATEKEETAKGEVTAPRVPAAKTTKTTC